MFFGLRARLVPVGLAAILAPSVASSIKAQGTKAGTESVFPPFCATVPAPSKTAETRVLKSVDDNDALSAAETVAIQSALYDCPRGRAVEPTTGANRKEDAIIIDSLTVAMDDGEAAFGSRASRNYQLQQRTLSQVDDVCGIPGLRGVRKSLIATLEANGTLASLIVPDRRPSGYCFSAAYAGEAYRSVFGFSAVEVNVK